MPEFIFKQFYLIFPIGVKFKKGGYFCAFNGGSYTEEVFL